MRSVLSLDFVPPQGGCILSQTCYKTTSHDDVADLEIFEIYISDATGGGIRDKKTGIRMDHIGVDAHGIPHIYDMQRRAKLNALSYESCRLDGRVYKR